MSQVHPASKGGPAWVFSRSHRFYQKPAVAWTSHGRRVSLRHLPTLLWSSSMTLPQGAGESLLQNLHICSPSFSTDLSVCMPASLKYSHSSLLWLHCFCIINFFPLNILSYPLLYIIQLLIVSALAKGGSILEPLTLPLAVEHGGSF